MTKQVKRRKAREYYVLMVPGIRSDYWPKISVTKGYALDEKRHYEKLGYEVELLKVVEVMLKKRGK